jgi:guanine deaminase
LHLTIDTHLYLIKYYRSIQVGLGTDVSGGFSPSILNAIQNASIASKVIACHADTSTNHIKSHFAGKQLPVATLLYLATLGGAELCCLDKHIGSFAEGKAFDALVVSTRGESLGPNFWDPYLVAGGSVEQGTMQEELNGLLERFLFCGDDRNINRVYVQGRWIGGTAWREGHGKSH